MLSAVSAPLCPILCPPLGFSIAGDRQLGDRVRVDERRSARQAGVSEGVKREGLHLGRFLVLLLQRGLLDVPGGRRR
jgi:hypothetical protein